MGLLFLMHTYYLPKIAEILINELQSVVKKKTKSYDTI